LLLNILEILVFLLSYAEAWTPLYIRGALGTQQQKKTRDECSDSLLNLCGVKRGGAAKKRQRQIKSVNRLFAGARNL
jgi:hypothetical protein